MKQKFAFVVLFSLLSVVAFPLVVAGAPEAPVNVPRDAVGTAAGLIAIIENIVNWVFAFMIALSVIFILIAGFQFITGGAKGAEEGREKLIWAIVGIIIAVLAKSIPAAIGFIVKV